MISSLLKETDALFYILYIMNICFKFGVVLSLAYKTTCILCHFIVKLNFMIAAMLNY